MKKIVMWLLVLCMMPGCAGAETLQRTAIELAQSIDALADSNEYLALMLGSEKLEAKVREIAAGEHGQDYTMMVNVDMSDAIASLLKEMAADTDFSDPIVHDQICKRLNSAILFQAIAAQGAETLAASNVITDGVFFATDEEPGEGVFLIFYGEHSPVAVTWSVQDGAASLSAMFVPVPELQACTTPEQVADWFASVGAKGAMVTAVD